MRALIGEWLRRLADRVDKDNAMRTPGWGFRFEQGVGVVWTENPVPNSGPPTACRVWYFPKDYQYARGGD
jgi:hypothetical protein